MHLNSSHQKDQSHAIPSNNTSSSIIPGAQEFKYDSDYQVNCKEDKANDCSSPIKVLLKLKKNSSIEFANQDRRPKTSLKQRFGQDQSNTIFSVENRMRVLGSSKDCFANDDKFSPPKKGIAPVLGYPLNKSMSERADKFVNMNMPNNADISNLKSQAIVNLLSHDRPSASRQSSTKRDRLFLINLNKEKRLNYMRTNSNLDQGGYLKIGKKASYSPKRLFDNELINDSLLKQKKAPNHQGSAETEKAGLFNSVPIQEGENRENNKNLENKIIDLISKEGSILKYFRSQGGYSRSAQMLAKRGHSSVENSNNNTRVSCNSPPSRSIDMKRGIPNMTLSSTQVYTRSSTIKLQSDRSPIAVVSRAHPSTSFHTSRAETSLTANKCMSSNRERSEDSPYINNFLDKVHGFIKEKNDIKRQEIQASGKSSDPTIKCINLVKKHSVPDTESLHNLNFSSCYNPEYDSSQKIVPNTASVRISIPESSDRNLFAQETTQREDSSIRGRHKPYERKKQETVVKQPDSGLVNEVVESKILNVEGTLDQTSFENGANILGTISQIETQQQLLAPYNSVEPEQHIKSLKKVTEENPTEVEKHENPGATINDLVNYAKIKSKEIEDYLIAVSKRGGNQNSLNHNLGIADVIAMRGGTYQENFRLKRDKPRTFREERTQLNHIYKEISSLEETFDEDRKFVKNFYEKREQALEKAALLRPEHLTQKELAFAREFYQETEHEDQKYRKLDQMLSRLRFFNLLTWEARQQFYKHAHYVKYEAGSYVFHEGDYGDLMYVILKGSVNVKMKKKLNDGQIQSITRISLSDGSHFGDLAMIVCDADGKDSLQMDSFQPTKKNFVKSSQQSQNSSPKQQEQDEKPKPEADDESEVNNKPETPKDAAPWESKPLMQKLNTEEKALPSYMLQQKRSATIQCAEECELLAIEREKYQDVLSNVMNRDMDIRIKLLNLIPFFKGMDLLNLIPFATNLRKEEFKLGQRIIKEGEPLMKFYILLKGKCQVVKEIVEDCRLGNDHNQSKLRSIKLKSFEKRNKSSNHTTSRDSIDQTRQDTSIMEKIIDKATEEDPSKKEKLREKLKPFSFRSAEEKLRSAKITDMKNVPPNPNERAFTNAPIKQSKTGASIKPIKSDHLVKNHAVFSDLTIGTIFGFRPIFMKEIDAIYKDLPESKARLSVIANSLNVELYSLTRDSLTYLPEGIKNTLIENVEKIDDFDDFDIKEGLTNYGEWKKFKQNIAKEVFEKPDPDLEKMKDFYKAY